MGSISGRNVGSYNPEAVPSWRYLFFHSLSLIIQEWHTRFIKMPTITAIHVGPSKPWLVLIDALAKLNSTFLNALMIADVLFQHSSGTPNHGRSLVSFHYSSLVSLKLQCCSGSTRYPDFCRHCFSLGCQALIKFRSYELMSFVFLRKNATSSRLLRQSVNASHEAHRCIQNDI